MTYSEILENGQSGCSPAEVSACQVLNVMRGRKGFDWWWHDIGEENHDKIFAELVQAVKLPHQNEL